jgi:hypothetical protein
MSKTPWGENTPWKNSVAFFTYLRGCLRKALSNNPIKIILINKKRKQITNPNPKGNKPTVWGFTCEMCKNDFVMKECQVDHINPAGSLQSLDDVRGFVERLLFVTEDDLRLVCKGCNSALSLSQRSGKSYEDSIIEKRIIAIFKSKQDKSWIEERGFIPESNAAKRRTQIREILKGEI